MMNFARTVFMAAQLVLAGWTGAVVSQTAPPAQPLSVSTRPRWCPAPIRSSRGGCWSASRACRGSAGPSRRCLTQPWPQRRTTGCIADRLGDVGAATRPSRSGLAGPAIERHQHRTTLDAGSAHPRPRLAATPIEIARSWLAIDGALYAAVAAGERRALDGAGDHHLADVDPFAFQPLGQQADQLVLGGVGERDAHRSSADGEGVHLRSDSPNAPLVTSTAPSPALFRSGSAACTAASSPTTATSNTSRAAAGSMAIRSPASPPP